MAYTRCFTGPATGAAGRGHVHPIACGNYIPANPPASGPPGPLARLSGLDSMTDLIREPLFIVALGAVALVLMRK